MPEEEHFDAVVVGSGFGGAVTAYRLAEAGWSVCLLERGRSFPPGSFPRSPADMSRNFWDPSKGLHGLFDVWTFRGLEALVGAGLGGGSLIYANVLLRKDERWFIREDRRQGTYEHWPVTREDLEPHYAEVEDMLRPQPYPFHLDPYSKTPKTQALEQVAEQLGLDWQLPPLAVTFANGGQPPVPGEPIQEEPNLHGRTRYTCRLVGECDLGCNYGSKNSLDYNYLSRFKGVLRTRTEVRRLEPATAGFRVHYVSHERAHEGVAVDTSKLPLRTVSAQRLVLAAGALGTTYLLFRNRSAFPQLSGRLGRQFCGNGDLLGFVVGARALRQGRLLPRRLDPSRGPVISSAIRVPDAADPDGHGRGFYLEDGGYPTFLDWATEAVNIPATATRVAKFVIRRLRNQLVAAPISNVSGEIGELLGGGASSSSRLPLLGMGRDVPDGVMHLQGGYLQVDWTIRTSRAYFDRLRSLMVAVARTLGGRLQDNPAWYFRRVITVHPLGGCPMGRDAAEGVVDAWGRVFGYPGLNIADGSVMPGPVGPNPALTIAALANRFADGILEEGKVPPAIQPERR